MAGIDIASALAQMTTQSLLCRECKLPMKFIRTGGLDPLAGMSPPFYYCANNACGRYGDLTLTGFQVPAPTEEKDGQ